MLDRMVHDELMQMLKECGAIMLRKEGEPCIELSSGLHTRAKYDFSRAFQYKEIRERLAREFVGMLGDEMDASAIDVIAGPESMGPFLAEMQNFSYFALSSCRLALAKKDKRGTFFFEKNCDLRFDDRVLFVDDVLTTGRTQRNIALALDGWHGRIDPPQVYGAVVLARTIPEHFHKNGEIFVPDVSLLSDTTNLVYPSLHCGYCMRQS
ncbi:MAG: hypothetical protein Q7R73_01095 [bacterium]|nr:hypothetical protein [bacterium]